MAYGKWGFIDGGRHKGFAGSYVPDTATLAQLTTFAAVLGGLSDAVPYKESLEAQVMHDYDLGECGPEGVERRATVVIGRVSDAEADYRISIPGVTQANIDKQGTAPQKLATASENTVLAAFETLTGYTDCYVKRSVITQRQA